MNTCCSEKEVKESYYNRICDVVNQKNDAMSLRMKRTGWSISIGIRVTATIRVRLLIIVDPLLQTLVVPGDLCSERITPYE